MRKLASVREISSVLAHPNADLLEIVTIDGWQTIVQNGKHNGQ